MIYETVNVGIYLNIDTNILWKKFEDTKEEIIWCISKNDRQYNGQKKAD